MCDGSVDLAAAGRALGFADDWYADEIPELLQMQEDGLLTYAGRKTVACPRRSSAGAGRRFGVRHLSAQFHRPAFGRGLSGAGLLHAGC